MNKLGLYPYFDHWFNKGGTVWLYSDPHFNDPDSEFFRKNCPSPDEQVKLINKYCGKNDTLIILGDVGDIEYVKKLKAGYKVLIKGNHDDKGDYFYKRNVEYDYVCHGETGVVLSKKLISDNHLFDEVIRGALIIRHDIVLSHEPYDSKYEFNIHGHDHNCQILKNLDNDNKPLIQKQLDYIKNEGLNRFNCCCEWTNYLPVNLNTIIKSGVLKNSIDIHREAIDKQSENPLHKKY